MWAWFLLAPVISARLVLLSYSGIRVQIGDRAMYLYLSIYIIMQRGKHALNPKWSSVSNALYTSLCMLTCCPQVEFFCLKYFKCLANFYHIIFMPEILTIVLHWLKTKGCFTVGPDLHVWIQSCHLIDLKLQIGTKYFTLRPDLQVPTVIGCPMWLYFLTSWVRTYRRSWLNLKWKPNSWDKSQLFF